MTETMFKATIIAGVTVGFAGYRFGGQGKKPDVRSIYSA